MSVRVSIIIPAYNAAETLGAQLRALLAQSMAEDLEILVCDNGSTDRTAEVTRAFTGDDARVRLIDASARRGPAAARNIGAWRAHGQILLFCDADDIVDPNWVDAMSDTISEGVALAVGRLEGRSLNTRNRYSVSWEVSGDIRLGFWPRFRAGGSGNMAVDARVFRALRGFDERLLTCEDLDLCWRAQLAGHRFASVPGAIVRCRQRDGLRAVYRQARAYGRGTRALQAKYSLISAADTEASALAEAAPAHRDDGRDAAADTPRPRGVFARLSRLLTPTGQANLAWRLGEAVGLRHRHESGTDPLPARLLTEYLERSTQ